MRYTLVFAAGAVSGAVAVMVVDMVEMLIQMFSDDDMM